MKGITELLATLGLAGALTGCAPAGTVDDPAKTAMPTVPVEIPKDARELVVGGGCFWCIEVLFEELKGVYTVESGYAGGKKAGVTYEEVGTGTSGHAEVIKIVFDPKVINTDDLLRVFFTVHDPTTRNRQGPDEGPQYRSVIFYSTDEEKASFARLRNEIEKAKIWKKPIVTTLEPLINYTRAEEYHQDYFAKFQNATESQRMFMNSGYCAVVVEPKVIKFRKLFSDKLKKIPAGG